MVRVRVGSWVMCYIHKDKNVSVCVLRWVGRQDGGADVSSLVFSFHLQPVSFEDGSIRGAFVRVCAGGGCVQGWWPHLVYTVYLWHLCLCFPKCHIWICVKNVSCEVKTASVDPDKLTTSAIIQDWMCVIQKKAITIQFMSQTIDFKKNKKKNDISQQLTFVCVHRSANIQFMSDKTRKEWVLKTCGSLVARQPCRSALEDLELSPIILKATIKLVWAHWCRLSVCCVAETDHRKLLILSTHHSLRQ